MLDVRDEWTAGGAYEAFMGRWSRMLAPRFVSWLSIPGNAHWLDVGCGTGALTSAICGYGHPASVVGCDVAESFVQYGQRHMRDIRASFVVADAGGLPPRAGGYGSVSSLLALNFFPDAEAALSEMRHVAASQGTVSACVWDYAGGMEFLRRFWDVASAADATVGELDEGVRLSLCRPAALIDLFRSVGLRAVRCDAIDIPTTFASFDDFWRPLLGGTGPAPAYVASLDAERRTALARKLEEALSPGGGIISLTARAWAVQGTV